MNVMEVWLGEIGRVADELGYDVTSISQHRIVVVPHDQPLAPSIEITTSDYPAVLGQKPAPITASALRNFLKVPNS